MRRYPLADLLAASGLTEAAMSRRVGLSGSTLKTARERGLTADAADRYAIRLGFHPFEVWPEMASDLLEREERECHADDCPERFIPAQPTQRYCSASCSSRHRRRVRYRTDPDYRARRQAQSAAYYEANGDYVRRRNQAAKAVYRRQGAAS